MTKVIACISPDTRKKKLLALFLPSLDGGGAERVMVTLANAFAARGYAVDLVLAKAQGPYLKDVSPAVRIVDLNVDRVLKAIFPLKRYIKAERPAAMLSAMGHANVVALLARKLAHASVRLVVSERGLISGEYAVASSLAARVTFMLVPMAYRWADAVCAVSKAASDDLAQFARLPSGYVKTLYNPFDLEKISELSKEELHHPWFAEGQPPVVLGIGRLNEAKDFSVLIRAFARVRASHRARLMILGEGELRFNLEALISALGLSSDDVQLPGFVSNPFSYLSRCSIFVLSSRREGLPGVLIEAMACGASVVSTNCLSGPDEILEGGYWGRLVPVGDVDALASAISSTLDTPKDKLPETRLRALDFDQEIAVDEYLRILNVSDGLHC